MGSFGPWHWIILIGVIVVLFGGRGKISGLMGDFAKGIKAFKSGMKDDETATSPPPQVPPPATTAAASPASDRSHEHG